jgi:hypothetical protein
MPSVDSVALQFASYEATNLKDPPNTCTLFDPQHKRLILFRDNNSTEWHTCVQISKEYLEEVRAGRNIELCAALLCLIAALLAFLACTRLLNDMVRLDAVAELERRIDMESFPKGHWRRRYSRARRFASWLIAAWCLVMVISLLGSWLFGRSRVRGLHMGHERSQSL